MISATNLRKSYELGGQNVHALNDVSLHVAPRRDILGLIEEAWRPAPVLQANAGELFESLVREAVAERVARRSANTSLRPCWRGDTHWRSKIPTLRYASSRPTRARRLGYNIISSIRDRLRSSLDLAETRLSLLRRGNGVLGTQTRAEDAVDEIGQRRRPVRIGDVFQSRGRIAQAGVRQQMADQGLDMRVTAIRHESLLVRL